MPAKTQTKSRFYIGQTIIKTRETIKKNITPLSVTTRQQMEKFSREFQEMLMHTILKQQSRWVSFRSNIN